MNRPPENWEQDDYSHVLLEEEQRSKEENRIAWQQYVVESVAAMFLMFLAWLMIAIVFTF